MFEDPDVVRKLETAFSIDSTVEEACFYAGISRTAYYDNIRERPELADRFDALRNKPVLAARDTIAKSLNQPQWASWYLSRKRKAEFSERIESDVTTNGESITPSIDILEIAKEVSAKLKEKKTK